MSELDRELERLGIEWRESDIDYSAVEEPAPDVLPTVMVTD